MGRVPIWVQWSIILAGVLLCPLLMLLLACVTGWLLFHKLWARPLPARGTSGDSTRWQHAAAVLASTSGLCGHASDTRPQPQPPRSYRLPRSTGGAMSGPQIKG
jgi:hypothetical protein